MSGNSAPFSERLGLAPDELEITIREDAPRELRYAILKIATDSVCDLRPSDLNSIVCGTLLVPDSGNWTEYPNIWNDVTSDVERCEWFSVYDISEAIYAYFTRVYQRAKAQHYENRLNAYFRQNGIGWQMRDGLIESRGDNAHEYVLHQAEEALQGNSFPTAHGEIRESIRDLSRRPIPDLSGAVHHAMAALECVARDVCGDEKATLGKVLSRNPDLFPGALNEAAMKAWGYASEEARHGREGRNLSHAEAELTVGMSAVLVTYLIRKKARQ